MKNSNVIITAGGIGKRFDSNLPKQFISLNGKAIITYSINEFLKLPNCSKIIITLPKNHIDYFNQNILQNYPQENIVAVAGGNERHQSIRRNLHLLEKNAEIVIIHDAVRPFISFQSVIQAIEKLENQGIIFASKSKNTLKTVENNIVQTTLDRNKIYNIQTPQIFRKDILVECYEKLQDFKNITDDASVLEKFGKKVDIFEYSDLNIKITDKNDLMLAKAIIKISENLKTFKF